MGALRFDDVLSARLLARQEPGLRARMLEHLDAMVGGGVRRSLLGTLVSEGRLSMEAARGVQDSVDRYRRGRGLGIYAELLAGAGLPADVVREEGRRLGQQADLESLGAALVAAGRLATADEERLRFQARVALDRDLGGEVARYVEGRRASGALPELAGEETEVERPAPSTASGVFNAALPPAGSALFRAGEVPLPTRKEARGIVQRNLTSSVIDLRGPRFRIPAWIDIGDPMVGKLIADRYRVVGLVGSGGNGSVYLAYKEDAPERPLAVKLLRRGANAQAVGRFKREALANSVFHHASALEIEDAGVMPGGEHWMAMEFFEGRDLARTLEEHGGRLPPRVAVAVVRKVLEVLEAAHAAKVVHRDVKPENILVSEDLSRVKLMDFGIALLGEMGEFEDRVFRTVGPDIVGTPKYMSPEQAGSEPLGPPSDLYSVGLVLYEALSGDFPFDSDSPLGYLASHITEDPKPLPASVPPALRQLVESLLQKDCDDRPQSARAVIEALDRIAPGLPA